MTNNVERHVNLSTISKGSLFRIKSIQKRETVFDEEALNEQIKRMNIGNLYQQMTNQQRFQYSNLKLEDIEKTFKDLFFGRVRS